MSLDVPYERLGVSTKVDYIPLKLALTDLPDNDKNNNNNNDVDTDKTKIAHQPKINIDTSSSSPSVGRAETAQSKQQFYDALVLGMLTFFCILVLLYAIYYFVILRDRQKSATIKPSYMF